MTSGRFDPGRRPPVVTDDDSILALVMAGTVMCIAALIAVVSVGVPGWLFWTVVGLVAVFLVWAVVRLGRRTK